MTPWTPGKPKILLACSGMMLESYDWLRARFTDNGRLNELRSYYEMTKFTGHTLPMYGKFKFIDSGAFSAWSAGAEIDIKVYGDFLKKYGSQVDAYANLDAIPVTRDAAGTKYAAAKTWENQKKLEDMGLKPIPVFHKGEPWEYLERYLADGYDYLCLGGLVADAKGGSNEEFFDAVWSRFLTDKNGKPKIRVHGFGMTSLRNMLAYPWFSVDSSTWLIHSKLGFICVPVKHGNEYDYDVKPQVIGVSDKSTSKQEEGSHIDTVSDVVKMQIFEYLKEKDIRICDLRTTPAWRFAANFEYWIACQNNASFQDRYFTRQVELL